MGSRALCLICLTQEAIDEIAGFPGCRLLLGLLRDENSKLC